MKKLYDYFLIILGVSLMAVALNMFYNPNNMVVGGFSGIAVIIEKLGEKYLGIKISLSVTNLILNIPLFIYSIKIFGYKFLKKTVFASLYFSFALFYTDFLPVLVSDYLIASVFGGVLTGIGLSLVFMAGATTGGTDLLSGILNKKFRNISVANLLFFVDSLIIFSGFVVFGSLSLFYSLIAVFITGKIIDYASTGLKFATGVFIISEKEREITQVIIQKMNRGVTKIEGTGVYTGNKRGVIFSVLLKKEVLSLKKLVKEIDNNAFVIVFDVKEALGEGFNEISI